MVQWIRGIPTNVEVRVYDYDVDGVDPGAIASDGEGNPCVVAIYEGTTMIFTYWRTWNEPSSLHRSATVSVKAR